MAIKREYGAEQPYIPAGLFKIRIPWVHIPFTMPEFIQGFLMVATPMSMSVCVMHMLGLPFELAMIIIFFHNASYMLHPMFGDPTWPGAVTPSVALVMAWGLSFPVGPERIQAAIAVELILAFLFFFFGITGLAKKVMSYVPVAMVSGILLGAGISSVNAAFGKQMVGQEFSVIVGLLIAIVILYSVKFKQKQKGSSFLAFIAKYGMLPGILAGMLVGWLTGQIKWPATFMDQGLFLPFHRIPEMIANYSIFGVGIPPLSTWIAAIPMAITIYIIAFGDIVFAEQISKTADEARADEKLEFNASRSNIICAVRNLFFGLLSPYSSSCGPIWGGGHVATVERYRQGRDGMDSLYSGIFFFIFTMTIGLAMMPVVNFFKPTLALSLAMTFIIQGFATGYIALNLVKTPEERGIAVLMAIILALKGSLWGLPAGIILCLVIGNSAVKEVIKGTNTKIETQA